ncbi:uncharacterized protein LOC124162647 [Ischnura elegans]|uniref:uncharacterized protein LOC124162647 n=1 Tax=Ischnura elegans TaxID=197161 RepID=UPI001ED8BFE3|nr:uncharacterized protein LOC124162647 [Ischnura elegans]
MGSAVTIIFSTLGTILAIVVLVRLIIYLCRRRHRHRHCAHDAKVVEVITVENAGHTPFCAPRQDYQSTGCSTCQTHHGHGYQGCTCNHPPAAAPYGAHPMPPTHYNHAAR